MASTVNFVSNLLKQRENFQNTNDVLTSANKFYISFFGFLFAAIPAVLISVQCNPKSVFYPILHFIFADLYIFIWALKKFVFKGKMGIDADYCPMP